MSSLHERAKDVFLATLSVPTADRTSFLAERCGDDTALRLEVESLLTYHSDPRSEGSSGSGDRSVPKSFAAGEVFAGRYRMIAQIGRGGMGVVWRADHLVLETPAALKPLDSRTPDARVRILNEVRLARVITHQAICRVFDVGEADGGIFY